MTSAQLAPAILIPLVAWRVYARVRRNVGRQRLRPRQLGLRLLFGTLAALAVAGFVARHLPALAAEGAGLLGGALLAVLGLKLTRWEMTTEGNFYTPNAFLGIALALLLAGRIVYRCTLLLTNAAPSAPSPPLSASPLTLAIFGLAVGYFIAYSAGVIVRGRHVA